MCGIAGLLHETFLPIATLEANALAVPQSLWCIAAQTTLAHDQAYAHKLAHRTQVAQCLLGCRGGETEVLPEI